MRSTSILGGHSTGGTLALLTADERLRASRRAFAFGAVSRIDRYPLFTRPRPACPDSPESRLRSPIHWLEWTDDHPPGSIEGAESPGNREQLDGCVQHTRNPVVHCIRGAGVRSLQRARPRIRVIAARLGGERGR